MPKSFRKPVHQLAGNPVYPIVLAYAKANRRQMTPAEAVFWQKVRDRKLGGYKFRRQHPISVYIADFVCMEARLIVELDGPIHHKGRQPVLDERRTKDLMHLGFRVVRYRNEQVFDEMPHLLADLLLRLETPLPPSAPERSP